MLETDEVDVDLFTPAPGTSLATIFSVTQVEQDKDNTSLKYIPQTPIKPIQEPIIETPKSHTPATDCIFSSVVTGYEWVNGAYNLRENLGFAIIKSVRDNSHNLIIYTAEKKTLSLATITSSFSVNVKRDVSISYYDNYEKYWLICASEAKIVNIVDCLKNLNVNIKHSTDKNVEEISEDTIPSKGNVDSNADSTNDKKSKDSILKRMATMGQSVLPPKHNIAVQSTDSTDNETIHHENHHKLPRHKLNKSVSKKSTVDKIMPSTSYLESNKPMPAAKPLTEISSVILPSKKELAFMKNTDINESSHSQYMELNAYDMNCFISEQRISNTELRINVNRLSDKFEQLLDKAQTKELARNQPMDIVDKLIKEYEGKIQSYEKFIESKGFDCSLIISTSNKNDVSNLEGDESKQMMLLCHEKDKEIEKLKSKLQDLTETHSTLKEKCETYENTLLKELIELKRDISDKNKVMAEMNSNIQTLMANRNNNDMTGKLKKVMNDTYQTISMNFNDEDNYLGATVKTVVGTVIKNSTLESLNDSMQIKSNK